MEAVGRLVCRLTGKHRWDYRLDYCNRCRRTGAEIVAGVMTTEKLVDKAAYWEGVEAAEAGFVHRLDAAFLQGAQFVIDKLEGDREHTE